MSEMILHLAANLLIYYVYGRFYRMFLGVPEKGQLAELLGFMAAFGVNSAVGMLVDNAGLLNLASSLIPLILVSLLYAKPLRVRLMSAFLTYAPVFLLDVGGFFVNQYTKAQIPQGSIGLLITALLFLLIQLVIEKEYTKGNGQPLRWSQWLAVFALPLGSIAVILIAMNSNYSSEGIIAISLLQLGMTILIFHLYSALGRQYESEYEKKMLVRQNRAYENQFALMRQSTKNMQAQSHDFKNHLMALGGLLEQGETKRALEYVQEISRHATVAGDFVKTGNTEIDGILNYKLAEAQKLGAELHIDIKLPSDLKVSAFDLSVILGNLLDNAITAMEGHSERKLWVSLKYGYGQVLIEVKNTYDGVVEEGEGLGGKVLRTRKQVKSGHGIGLGNVQNVVIQHHGLYEVKHDDRIFCVKIALPVE